MSMSHIKDRLSDYREWAQYLANKPEMVSIDFLEAIKQLQDDLEQDEKENGWIPCSDRLPKAKGDSCWVKCIVSVIRSHYPTSTYDICAPYDEEYVMYANYDAIQKIWHLDSDEQVNALISIEDAPLNGDCVIAWMSLPEPYEHPGDK